METRNITDAWLRSVKPPPTGRIEVRDEKVRGLIVRITAAGTISYSARKEVAGRHSRVTLAERWPTLGIAGARRKALVIIGNFQGGGDPVTEARAAVAAEARSAGLPTVEARLDEWQRVRRGKWSLRHAAKIARVARVEVVPTMGNRPLAETTRAEWMKLVHEKAAGSKMADPAPAMAGLLYRIISSFLNYSDAAGWIPHALLPRRGSVVLAPPSKPRKRTLTDAELVAVWDAAGTLSARSCALVRLLTLTGARLNEVAGLCPAEIDHAAGLWRLPPARAKNRTGYVIPLSALALAEIEACNCAPRVGSLSKLKRQLDAKSGVSDWRLHDLRRTCRTGLSKLGIRREVAEAAINHIGGRAGIVGVYDQYGFNPEGAAALRQWQTRVASLIEPKRRTASRSADATSSEAAAQVVRLRRKRKAA